MFWVLSLTRPVNRVPVMVAPSCSASHVWLPVTVAIFDAGVMAPTLVAFGKKNPGTRLSRSLGVDPPMGPPRFFPHGRHRFAAAS
jgi:hypothetical protein